MVHVCNLSPLHRPPTPSLDRGPVQRRVRRAFTATGKPVLSTSQIVEWSHPAPAPIGTMRGVLSVASASAIANASAAATAVAAGRSCGDCATDPRIDQFPFDTLLLRHGLRASELVALRWDDINLQAGKLHVRRSKGGETSVHPLCLAPLAA
jgi:Phage integrase family